MAEEQVKKSQDGDDAATPEKAAGKTGGLKRLFSAKWIGIFVAASVVVHGAAFAYVKLADDSPAVSGESPEVELGTFLFVAATGEAGPIDRAEFSLHIAILDQVDEPARQRIEAYRFRVQQSVEELLRKAHCGDFDDPDLTGLKRQLQERINETLGMRVIADVIITDLKLKRRDTDLGLVTDLNESARFSDKPSS